MTGLAVPLAQSPDRAEVRAIEDAVLARVEPASAALVTASAEDAEALGAEAWAVESYLRRIRATTEAIGAAQTIGLRARMRLGELQTPKRPGPAESSSPRGDEPPDPGAVRMDRVRNRTLARNREEVEAKLVELAPKGEATPGALLRHLRRMERRTVDQDARSIDAPEGTAAVEGEGWTVLPGRFSQVLARWPAESVDMVLTDPPYPRDALPLWGELAALAERVLVPNGVLVALSGQLLLPDVLDQLRDSGLSFGWVYCQLLPGQHSRILGRNLAQSWKPWLVLTKGGWPVGMNERHEDVLPTSPAEKAGYSWRQTVGPARYLVEHLSPSGGVVLDPFLGTGTYGVAALEAGRRFVGVEADRDRFALACQRLGEVER